MGKKIFYIIIAIVVLLAVYYLVGPTKQVEGPTPGDELPIENDFGSKIVYTTNVELDPGPFEADCEARGGTFDGCGSVCEPEADICAEVCAYTCDLSGEDAGENATTTTENGTSTEME